MAFGTCVTGSTGVGTVETGLGWCCGGATSVSGSWEARGMGQRESNVVIDKKGWGRGRGERCGG